VRWTLSGFMAFRFSGEFRPGETRPYADQLVRSGPPVSVEMRADCHSVSHPPGFTPDDINPADRLWRLLPDSIVMG
jgi:hypothetical protein